MGWNLSHKRNTKDGMVVNQKGKGKLCRKKKKAKTTRCRLGKDALKNGTIIKKKEGLGRETIGGRRGGKRRDGWGF